MIFREIKRLWTLLHVSAGAPRLMGRVEYAVYEENVSFTELRTKSNNVLQRDPEYLLGRK